MHIMMDDVYIYHTHNFFGLCLFCVGTHEYLSTSQSHELTKRALESNDDLGSDGLPFPPLTSRKNFAHFFYMALTWLWVVVHYISFAHLAMFTLHDMPIPMPLPCICDPCFALHMMIDSSTCMCICKHGGDIVCYCHDCFVPHAYDDTMILICVHACDMSCTLPMSILCSHDMIAMISSSVLHLRSTSLHDLITMIACLVASPMIHTCSLHAVDDNHFHALHMIVIASCHLSPCVASLMLDDLTCIECNNALSLDNEFAPIAFSHIFGDFDIFLVKHACLTSSHDIPRAMNIAIVVSYYSYTCASNGFVQKKKTIMMDDVFIYHAHTFFVLLCACVGYLDFVSTSTSRELTIRALESELPSTTTILHRTCLNFGTVKVPQGHVFKVISFSFEHPQTMSMHIMDHITCVAFH